MFFIINTYRAINFLDYLLADILSHAWNVIKNKYLLKQTVNANTNITCILYTISTINVTLKTIRSNNANGNTISVKFFKILHMKRQSQILIWNDEEVSFNRTHLTQVVSTRSYHQDQQNRYKFFCCVLCKIRMCYN